MHRTRELMEIRPLVAGNRAYSETRRLGFAECAPSGRARLDAIAGWLQDVAYNDMDDSHLAEVAVWVARRIRVRVRRWPRFRERVELVTFCSGMGPMWAERRTDVTRIGEQVADVEAVCLWVHLDPISFQPMPLLDEERWIYGGGGARERRVSPRLRHPLPPEGPSGEQPTPWTFRASECDVAGHVNNAAYWRPLEEELLQGPDPETIDAELEYRTPSQAGERLFLRQGGWRWLVDDEGEVYASMSLTDGG